ncbi:MAG: hypothetical protein ACM3JK_06225, partial [Betaproteobacteria bacterium]
GYARGGEAVIFVENIRNYYNIMMRFESAYKSPYPALTTTKGALRLASSPARPNNDAKPKER